MNFSQKFNQLLEDEQFQETILDIDIRSSEEKQQVQKKFDITENELAYAYRLLSGISFSEKRITDSEINEKLKEFWNETSERQTAVSPLQWLVRVAAILSIPLLLSSVYFYTRSDKQNNQITYAQAPIVFNTFKAPMGAKTQIVLPDGSLVWLNSGSSLSFPSQFDSESRKVKLQGEAYFEVVKNEKLPMVVSLGSMKVKVYGTKFNVNAYEPDENIETTLVEGKVSITPENGYNETKIKPGYSATFNKGNNQIQVTQVRDMEAYTGWKDGKLLFHDQQFAEIAKKLERWYNVDIEISDKSLNDFTLYATFIDENIEQVFDILSQSIPIRMEYPRRKVNADGIYARRKIIIKRDTDKTFSKKLK